MLLNAQDIRFRFGSGFSLSVDRIHVGAGEFLGVIGRNGSGKTTMMRIICGLLSCDSGAILLDGQSIRSIPPARRGRKIVFVPQSHRPVFEFTVEQTVLLGRIPHRYGTAGFERPEDLDAAERAIELMNLTHLRRQSVTRLSGGELQRTILARALAQSPLVYVLDEPNTHLDIGHQLEILERIRREAKQRGAGILASMHDLNLASILCDHLILIDSGSVIAEGKPVDVLRADMLSRAFGATLEVDADAYGDAPAVRYRYDRTARS